MTQEAMAAAPSAKRRSPAFVVTQIIALFLAMYLGWHSYQMVDADRLDIDRALLWMAAAFGMLAYFAWDGALPRVRAWPRDVAAYVRAHPVELAALAVIVAAGVFVRLSQFGTLPPNGYLYFEEHINGGIGFDILHGDRPYAFPLERYSSALGQWLMGPSTIGLRLPMMTAGIVVILPFYLMVRELMDRPAALFAVALFASLRVVADTSSYFQVAQLVTITMVWLFVRGLRTGNAIWFVPVAAGAAILFYEYETFKAVPLLGAPFAAFYAARAFLWPLPRSTRDIWERTRALVPRAIKPVIVTAVVIIIGVGPMVAQTHRGQHIFFSSLDRQKGDRAARGTPGLISPDAAEQLKWSAQVFTPFVKAEFPVIGPIPIGGAVDRVTSVMLWISLVAAAAMFWRGARALFVAWFAGGVLVASLLLSDYGAWKIVGFLPAAVVLMGFLADDLCALARRRGDWLLRPLLGLLTAVAAVVLVLNVRTLYANADNKLVVGEWGNTPSQLYAICDHLYDRPTGNFAYVSQRARDWWGFSRPPGDDEERRAAWSDWKFICWGLQGEAIGSLQEAWPLFRDVDGPVNLTTIASDAELPPVVDALKLAMPDLVQPDRLTKAPGGLFNLLSYATTSSQLNERRGLSLSRIAPDGSKAGPSAVASGPEFALPRQAGAEAFTLSGIVYASKAMDASLVPDGAPGAPPVAITVDGRSSYDAVAAPGLESPQQLLQGWHLVQVRGYATADATLRLRWRARDGSTVEPGQNDFYAVEDLAAWRHTRTFEGPTTGQAVRFDFFPHLMNHDGLRIDATHLLPVGTRVNRDQWDARWTVPAAGKYSITINAPNENMRMTIDGKEVLTLAPPRTDTAFDVELTAGDHQVEIVVTQPQPRFIGVVMSVKDSSGNPVTMEVHPF